MSDGLSIAFTGLLPEGSYITDSGTMQMKEIEQGKKFDDDKPRMDLIPPLAIMEVAKVMSYGAKKYGDHNWLGGLKYSRVFAACLRHLFAWIAGTDNDPETGISHLAHAACCVLMLLDFVLRKRTALDDRYKETSNGRTR